LLYNQKKRILERRGTSNSYQGTASSKGLLKLTIYFLLYKKMAKIKLLTTKLQEFTDNLLLLYRLPLILTTDYIAYVFHNAVKSGESEDNILARL
jgi:hypothetical protein